MLSNIHQKQLVSLLVFVLFSTIFIKLYCSRQRSASASRKPAQRWLPRVLVYLFLILNMLMILLLILLLLRLFFHYILHRKSFFLFCVFFLFAFRYTLLRDITPLLLSAHTRLYELSYSLRHLIHNCDNVCRALVLTLYKCFYALVAEGHLVLRLVP